MQRRFPGVFIPAEVWLSTEISWPEKLYLAEIDSLDADEKGCFASNKFLGGFFNQSPQKAAAVINRLEERNFIALSYDANGKRYIKVTHSAFRGSLHENGELKIMNSSEVKEANEKKDLKRIAKDYFIKLYGFKARQLSGRSTREDGKPITPPWTGKEGSLFKSDFEQYGLQEMKRMMLLFFSDKVSEVADFTRYSAKAGYAYTVFHGMIPKLTLANRNVKEPCWECGSFVAHYPECSFYDKVEVKKEEDLEEIEKAREELGPDFSLQNMISNHLKEKREKEKNES